MLLFLCVSSIRSFLFDSYSFPSNSLLFFLFLLLCFSSSCLFLLPSYETAEFSPEREALSNALSCFYFFSSFFSPFPSLSSNNFVYSMVNAHSRNQDIICAIRRCSYFSFGLATHTFYTFIAVLTQKSKTLFFFGVK